MKDVNIRDQPTPLRRPIILRPPARETAVATQAEQPIAVSDTSAEVQRLREELDKCHESLEQWSLAEKEWDHQRTLFQTITENVTDLVVLLDTQGNRTWTNPAFNHILGYAPEELIGIHSLTEIHPDDRDRATEALESTLRDGVAQQVEFRLQKKDGDWVTLQNEFVAFLNAESHVESAMLLSSDLTENRKLTESLALASTQATAAALVEGMARDFDQILTNVVGNLTIAKNLNGPHNAIAVRPQ